MKKAKIDASVKTTKVLALSQGPRLFQQWQRIPKEEWCCIKGGVSRLSQLTQLRARRNFHGEVVAKVGVRSEAHSNPKGSFDDVIGHICH